MKAPDLGRLWESFIRVGGASELGDCRHIEILRADVSPLVEALLRNGSIEYYSFLLHGRGSVPAPEGDTDCFLHLRFGLTESADPERVVAQFPRCCLWTRKADPMAPRRISGLDDSKLAGGIEEAWRILGEQSEWLLAALAAFNPELPGRELISEIEQFLHFYDNMTGRQQEWAWFARGFMSSTVEENGERLRAGCSHAEITARLEARYRATRQG